MKTKIKKFHVAVDGVVKTRKGVLLMKREIKPFKGTWVLPGGAVEINERLADAVKREVKEETGLNVKVVKYVGYYDDPKRDPRYRSIAHVFLCKPSGGKLRGSFEGRELKFFKKLPRKTGFDHRKILKDLGLK